MLCEEEEEEEEEQQEQQGKEEEEEALSLLPGTGTGRAPPPSFASSESAHLVPPR